MIQAASSPLSRVLAEWVAGGDQLAFAAALAAHESASWKCGSSTGGVDESVATFDDQEFWIARCLARQGHNVIALPTRDLASLRSPDAAVSGLLTEFKCYTGVNPRQLLLRFGRAKAQADRVVVGVSARWDPAMARSVFRAVIKSACWLDMRAVMLIGDNFQFEWGDWNGSLTASASPSCLTGAEK